MLSRLAQTDSPERHSISPLWSPDGTRIAFLSTKDQTIMVQPADGSGTPEPLARFEHLGYPLSWTRDMLALVDYGRRVSNRISLLRLTQPLSEVHSLSGRQPAISPNGKWLAYNANEEVHVQDLAKRDPSSSYPVAAAVTNRDGAPTGRNCSIETAVSSSLCP